MRLGVNIPRGSNSAGQLNEQEDHLYSGWTYKKQIAWARA